MSKKIQYNRLGQELRKPRKSMNLTLRIVAEASGIDIALLSKMERGERKFSIKIVQQHAKFYDADEDHLLVFFHSDPIVRNLYKEPHALMVFKVAEESLRCQVSPIINISKLKKKIS